MEGKLNQFTRKITIDLENLTAVDAKPHERIIEDALESLEGENFDESFLRGNEIKFIIEEELNKPGTYDSWQNQLETSEDAEKKEKELAKTLAIHIRKELDEKQRDAA